MLSEDYTISEEYGSVHIRVYECKSPEYNTEDGVLYPNTKVFSISSGEYNSGAPVAHDPVYGRLTLWYKQSTDENKLVYRCMNRISCDFSLADSSFSIVKQNVHAVQSGAGIGGVINEDTSKDVSGTSWSMNTGFSGKLLAVDTSFLSARWTVTYKRQGSNMYSFTIDHRI